MMSNILQLVGATAITVGVLLLSVPAGVIVGGIVLLLVGLSVVR
jgi:hypothetical protein